MDGLPLDRERQEDEARKKSETFHCLVGLTYETTQNFNGSLKHKRWNLAKEITSDRLRQLFVSDSAVSSLEELIMQKTR